MMGSLMADLEQNLSSLNKWLSKNNQAPLTQDQLLIRLFREVETIWPDLGYPPLVTPYSQYVKNVALMNVIQMIKGRERWSMIDDNTWDMLLGKSGKVPGPIAAEIKQIATDQGKVFYEGHPQDLYPDALPIFRKEMEEMGWETGEDDEELMELAMHPQQYRKFKSGEAKAEFEKDLAEKRSPAPGNSYVSVGNISTEPQGTSLLPKSLRISVNGQPYQVEVSYNSHDVPVTHTEKAPVLERPLTAPGTASGHKVLTPLEGVFYWTREPGDSPKKVGDNIRQGEVIGYVEAMKVFNAIVADQAGIIVQMRANGSTVEEDDVLATLSPASFA